MTTRNTRKAKKGKAKTQERPRSKGPLKALSVKGMGPQGGPSLNFTKVG